MRPSGRLLGGRFAFAVVGGCASLVVLAELGYRFATTRSFRIPPFYFEPGMLAEIHEKHPALRRIAMARGAGLIDVEAALDTIRGQPRRGLFLDEWHLSKTGNRMVARMVAAGLLADRSNAVVTSPLPQIDK